MVGRTSHLPTRPAAASLPVETSSRSNCHLPPVPGGCVALVLSGNAPTPLLATLLRPTAANWRERVARLQSRILPGISKSNDSFIFIFLILMLLLSSSSATACHRPVVLVMMVHPWKNSTLNILRNIPVALSLQRRRSLVNLHGINARLAKHLQSRMLLLNSQTFVSFITLSFSSD